MFDASVQVGVVSIYVRALGDLMNLEQQHATVKFSIPFSTVQTLTTLVK